MFSKRKKAFWKYTAMSGPKDTVHLFAITPCFGWTFSPQPGFQKASPGPSLVLNWVLKKLFFWMVFVATSFWFSAHYSRERNNTWSTGNRWKVRRVSNNLSKGNQLGEGWARVSALTLIPVLCLDLGGGCTGVFILWKFIKLTHDLYTFGSVCFISVINWG